MDVAATEFYDDGSYTFEGGSKSSDEMTAYYAELVGGLPDRLDRGPARRGRLGRLEGDHRPARRQDPDRRRRPVRHQRRAAAARHRRRPANALLVKVNQIGSLTETLDAVDLAHRNGSAA